MTTTTNSFSSLENEAIDLCELIECEVWTFENGEHAAANSDKSRELCAAGLRVVLVTKHETDHRDDIIERQAAELAELRQQVETLRQACEFVFNGIQRRRREAGLDGAEIDWKTRLDSALSETAPAGERT